MAVPILPHHAQNALFIILNISIAWRFVLGALGFQTFRTPHCLESCTVSFSL